MERFEEVSKWFFASLKEKRDFLKAHCSELCPSERMWRVFLVGLATLTWSDFFLDLRTSIDVNAYYYTLSTIAQSLASAFGFLAAVAVFRIQFVEREVETAMDILIDHFPDNPRRKLHKCQNRFHFWDEMENLFPENQITNSSWPDEQKTLVSSIRRSFVDGRGELVTLRRDLIRVLVYTSACITVCFALISVSQLLKTNRSLPVLGSHIALLAVYFVIFCSCRCVWFFWDIARRITTRRPKNIVISLKDTIGFLQSAEGEFPDEPQE